MHNLMMHATPLNSRSVHVQAVIDHPLIADCFFTVKLSEFIDQWLNGIGTVLNIRHEGAHMLTGVLSLKTIQAYAPLCRRQL